MGAIHGCGGSVLSRGSHYDGTVSVYFEFERQSCMDIYGGLVAVGVELGQSGHILLTELCHCTQSQQPERGKDLASIDLEVQTYPAKEVDETRELGTPRKERHFP
jgi:hypothetical protein